MAAISVATTVANANAAFDARKGAAGLADARNVFDGALLELVDDISEEEASVAQSQGPMPQGVSAESIVDPDTVKTIKKNLRWKIKVVCDLWLAWASMEKGKKQWKQVVKVFDQVNNSPARANAAFATQSGVVDKRETLFFYACARWRLGFNISFRCSEMPNKRKPPFAILKFYTTPKVMALKPCPAL
jgi:hypothetical protein